MYAFHGDSALRNSLLAHVKSSRGKMMRGRPHGDGDKGCFITLLGGGQYDHRAVAEKYGLPLALLGVMEGFYESVPQFRPFTEHMVGALYANMKCDGLEKVAIKFLRLMVRDLEVEDDHKKVVGAKSCMVDDCLNLFLSGDIERSGFAFRMKRLEQGLQHEMDGDLSEEAQVMLGVAKAFSDENVVDWAEISSAIRLYASLEYVNISESKNTFLGFLEDMAFSCEEKVLETA